MNPRVKEVTACPDHTLVITFTNGECRRFDVRPYLEFTVFQPLKDIGYFLRARVEHGTVIWPGEIDFCPDTLYLESVPVKESADAA